MTEEEWEEHLNFLDNAEISPYPITVGGSHTRGYGTVVPYLYVDQEEREKEEMEEDIACSQWTIDVIEATQNPDKLREFREKYGDKGLPPKNVSAASLGRLGGLVKSEAKSTASRANGRKGGRPKSTKSIDMGDI